MFGLGFGGRLVGWFGFGGGVWVLLLLFRL